MAVQENQSMAHDNSEDTPSDADPDEDENSGDSVEVACHHCGYVWRYTGEMWTATCPRCNKKTPSGLKPDEFKDDDEE